MIKEETRTETRKYLHITYYCDNCGKELDSVDENDDGSIPSSKYEYTAAFYVPKMCKWFRKEDVYCKDCAAIFEDAFVNELKFFNFREG